eukprot:gnl/Trimastix_PCT/312.p2 GENE.gnl/Trimastix_PCT/312~~gnl/Trimastix_PCT/312.p2  ORF type:complete len:513 (-),score=172.06 gnl/Trimastix_PCT/312:99-1637(-)
MSRVRNSKFRHVFGATEKSENCFHQICATQSSWDSNFIKVNTKFFATVWRATGGGRVGVIPVDQPGRYPVDTPLLLGHTRPVIDLEFNPFIENILATGSEDCTVNLWNIPDGGLTENMTQPLLTLSGFTKKVGMLKFHPTASNVLMTLSADHVIRLWDVEKAQEKIVLNQHTQQVTDVVFNEDGSLMATQCPRQKLVRIIDPRANTVAMQTAGHLGPKAAHLSWFKNRDWLCSAGFGRQSDRQLLFWDPRNFDKPMATETMEQAPGAFTPFYDEGTSVLYLFGKGDTAIRYYEIVDQAPFCHYISTFRSSDSLRGAAMAPKTSLALNECEIARFYRLDSRDKVEIVHFTVPRKSDTFQPDLYPETPDAIPVLTADEYFAGEIRPPRKSALTPESLGQAAPTASFQVAEGATGVTAASAAPAPSPASSPASSPAPQRSNAAVERLEKELGDAKATIAEQKGKIDELSAQKEQLESALTETTAEITSLQTELQQLRIRMRAQSAEAEAEAEAEE